MDFQELGLIDPILDALDDKNYKTPTLIQEKAIPIILERNDMLGCAQTGTGKTAAFAIPIIQLIHQIEGRENKPTLRALIVTPTRELAIQIDENIREYAKYTKIRHAVIFGGVKQHAQVDALRRGVHIITATPGRLLDLMDQGYIRLNTIKMFVLDEADRMLDMGFIHDIRKLIKVLPEKRQSLFFSATMPKDIVKLSNTILISPKSVTIEPEKKTAETVSQYVYYTNRESKKDLLLHIIEQEEMEQVLLFARTKHGADRIARKLKKDRIRAESIHGDKSQNQRQNALKQFKEGRLHVLVATDIAARGIDIDKLKYVINYDVPNVPETYVHRIGRSGRAGESGIAISICEPEENVYFKDIQKLVKNGVKVIKQHPYPQTDKPMTAAERRNGIKKNNAVSRSFLQTARKDKAEDVGRSEMQGIK